MRTFLINLGQCADGRSVVPYLEGRKDIRLCAVTCTDDREQYERIVEASGNADVYAGTKEAILSSGSKASSREVLSRRAWDVILEAVEQEENLEILNYGSLTNLAIAFVRKPEIVSKVKRIIIVGGSTGSGDVTPFAESGIYADPMAAKIVFQYGIPILLAGLELRKKVTDYAQEVSVWAKRPGSTVELAEQEALLCAVLLEPASYETKSCFVGIETKSEKTRGMTVCDLYHRTACPPNAEVAVSLHPDKVKALVTGVRTESIGSRASGITGKKLAPEASAEQGERRDDELEASAELSGGDCERGMQSGKIPIIIDTDPGHDDAFAIMMALSSDKLEVKGLTTVAGNSVIENTTRNALRILERVGRTDVPVAKGIGRPMCHELQYEVAKQYHGESGLDGPVFPEVRTPVSELDAVSFIATAVRESKEKITLVPIGPLTNIAAFLLCYPELTGKIERICMMGGLTYPDPNSATIVSEYNVFQDIEAARIVFQSGIPIVMHTINSTGRGKVRSADIDQMAQLGNAGQFAAELMDFYRKVFQRNHLEYYNICDSHAIAYLIDPAIYQSRVVDVSLDLEGEYTSGMTVCDLREDSAGDGRFTVVEDCDLQGYFELMFACLRALG